MKSKPENGCIIDGAVPRSNLERCRILCDWLEQLGDTTNCIVYRNDIATMCVDGFYRGNDDDQTEFVNALENQICDSINAILAETNQTLLLEAGDVVICDQSALKE